ncbi:hypothetical protein KL86CLO1_10460 [uncultured Eubacteriales bacterium]|uniref:Uncharacterized protein n=1 Tax=uncultured Eubacteriales bacterium TaxID=172733 RepID=A0A212J3T0_9FIRM|nr:hypothetical protein KL86CLO1_10460 [uncultured Eubacteriales bacterium]
MLDLFSNENAIVAFRNLELKNDSPNSEAKSMVTLKFLRPFHSSFAQDATDNNSPTTAITNVTISI